MGTAMCLGHAAGAYAALAASGQATLENPAVDTLRQVLRSQGALISADEAVANAEENAVEARAARTRLKKETNMQNIARRQKLATDRK